jgi:hypothetical protein
MRSPPRNIFDVASDLSGPPTGGPVEAWLFGVVLAWPLILYGLVCVITRHAWFLSLRVKGLPPPPGIFHEWVGSPAMVLGLVYIGVGLFAHFRWFWSIHRTLYRYYEIGQLGSLVVLVTALVWWVIETIW